MNRTKIAAIDVGTTKVSTVIADMRNKEDMRILGIGITPSQGLEHGLVSSAEDAASSISQSIAKAERMAGCKLKSAYISMSGTDTISLNSRGVVSIPRDNRMVHVADRRRALEIAQSVDVPKDRSLLHVIPRSYTLDGQENIKDPVNMYGARLNVDTHIVTAATISVQSLTKCITNLGVKIDGIILQSLASAEAVLKEEEKQEGVVIADIGGTATNIAVYKDGSVYHTSAVPVGGFNVSNDIAIGLEVSFDTAEEAKKKYGNLLLDEEVVNSTKNVSVNGTNICFGDLCEIIGARMDELLHMIIAQIPQSDYARATPSTLVLTGGGANLTGISEFAHRATRLHTRIGTPLDIDEDDTDMLDPAYATSIGLLHWSMKNAGSQTYIENTKTNPLSWLAKIFG